MNEFLNQSFGFVFITGFLLTLIIGVYLIFTNNIVEVTNPSKVGMELDCKEHEKHE